MSIRYLFIYLLSIGISASAKQSTNPSVESIPEIGMHCPDFTLTHVTHYSKKQVSLSDFEGKWLFLDFWFTGCTNCIKSFPKINELQQEFKDKVQFLLVGMNDTKWNGGIERLFEKLSTKQGLSLACAYDSLIHPRWKINSMPHMVIVDPAGIVRHIIGGRDLTSQKIHSLLEGKPVYFFAKEDRVSFNPEEIISQPQDASMDKVIYRSILTHWSNEKQSGGYKVDDFVRNKPEVLQKGWTVAMVPLYALYNYAYLGWWTWTWRDPEFYGQVYHKPILHLNDSSLFEYDYKLDVGKGTYNYNLTVPLRKISKEFIMEEIQNDLKSVFGYDVSIQYRKMPVWKLTAKPGAEKRLRTKGGEPFNSEFSKAGYRSVAAGFTLKNQPLKIFMVMITGIISERDLTPFLDQTGITGNIDITIEADLTDPDDINRALRKHGLFLERDTKEMKVIVISDPDQE